MHIIQNYTLKKIFVKKILPLVMALLRGIKNLFGPLLMTWTVRATAFHFSGSSGTTCTRTSFKNSIADSPTRRCYSNLTRTNFFIQLLAVTK